MTTTWFDETLYPFYRQGIRVDGVLFRGQTKFQTVEVIQNERLGRVLTLDGVVLNDMDRQIARAVVGQFSTFSITNNLKTEKEVKQDLEQL